MNHNETKFIDTSKEVKNEIANLAKKGLREGGKILKKKLKTEAPKSIRRGISAKVKIDRATGQIQLDFGYINKAKARKKGIKHYPNPAWFEFGTRPHSIKIKRKKLMVSSGGAVIGKSVNHPGTTAKHPLRNTSFNNVSELRLEQEKALKEINKVMIREGMHPLDFDEIEVDGDD